MQFVYGVNSLAFSVSMFLSGAVIAFTILMVRRCKTIGGELGGPKKYKYLTSAAMFGLWLAYLTISSLEAYDVIEGF